MSRIGQVFFFIVGSVVAGLALAFIIVAWRPQLVRVAPAAPPPAAQIGAPASPDTGEAPGGARAGSAASKTSTGEPPTVLYPGHDAWSYADAVQRAGPAVVYISTSRTVTERLPTGFGPFFDDFAPRYRNLTEHSLGSGVIVDKEGHIATNNHVVENADQVRVRLAARRGALAKVVGRDPDSDLALLQISLDHLPVMPFGHSD